MAPLFRFQLLSRVPRVRHAIGAVARYFPWTPLGGTAALSAGLAVHQLAYGQLDFVWLVLGLSCLALCVLAALWVVPVALWLRFRDDGEQTREHLHLETGVPRDTGYRLPRLSLFPLVQVEARWLSPPLADLSLQSLDGQRSEHAVASDRGKYQRIERRLTVQDPFGLARIHIDRPAARPVDMLPRLGGLSRLPSLSSLAAGDELPHPMGLADGDRLEISPYVPGDPARFIHWKIFARTRSLNVRRPERALSVARRMAAFFVPGEDDDATAALCRLALVRGMLGEQWRFGTSAHPEGTSDPAEAIDRLLRTSGERARAAEGLAAFFKEVERGGPAALLVFVPPRAGPWLAQVVAAAAARRLRVLIAVDTLAEAAPPGRFVRLARFWLRPPRVRDTTREDLATVVETLRRAGCDVMVFDRQRGSILAEGRGGASPRGVAA
ncbi:MAG: DUF58 domain-containing protein [Myxococcales bacterium]|nr:DUF58 domain-containing protein [Myxococcales bacterium]